MEKIIDKNYKMEKEEEIRRSDKSSEFHLLIRLMKLLEMPQPEHIRLEKLEAINQAITNLEEKETLGKYTSFTVNEKRVRNSPDYSPTFAEEPSTHPPLREKYSMSTTPGFKFQPNDEEIIWHLENKRSNPCQTPSWSPIKDCPGLYGTQPGHLPDANGIKEKKALYYYVRTKKKSGNGDRTGPNGFWRATRNNKIWSETGSEIGYKRTLKYCEYPDENHKSSKLKKQTNWLMHEYGLATTTSSQSQEESFKHWTICKVTWTEKSFEVTNDFSREGSIGPSENKHKNELTMHTQNEGDPKISKIVDSKPEEIAQTNDHSIGDEFRRLTQVKRGELREQRMNRETHQPEEISPCYASGIHPTPSIMATTHEIEKGVEPRQLENPGRITEEFGPSIEQTSTSCWLCLDGREDGIQSRYHSWTEPTSPLLGDCFSYSDFTGR